jgi:hypothetical protein
MRMPIQMVYCQFAVTVVVAAVGMAEHFLVLSPTDVQLKAAVVVVVVAAAGQPAEMNE